MIISLIQMATTYRGIEKKIDKARFIPNIPMLRRWWLIWCFFLALGWIHMDPCLQQGHGLLRLFHVCDCCLAIALWFLSCGQKRTKLGALLIDVYIYIYMYAYTLYSIYIYICSICRIVYLYLYYTYTHLYQIVVVFFNGTWTMTSNQGIQAPNHSWCPFCEWRILQPRFSTSFLELWLNQL